MSSHFHSQVETLVLLGYPRLFAMAAAEFRESLRPLARYACALSDVQVDPGSGKLPFVLVVRSPRAAVETTLPLVVRRGKVAVERLYPKRAGDFAPIASVSLPDGDAYLICHVDRGSETLNITPDQAYRSILAQDRSPLTIEEGVAVLTHFPEFLQPGHCFSLLGSRCGDRRVPALWLSDGRPKLGWCWAGNPHTWLGSASCAGRTGVARSTEALPVA